MADNAIISIRPNFAEAILAGSKTVELRRRIPPLDLGTRLWIYATLPVGAVVGSAMVHSIFQATPEKLWLRYEENAGIDRAAFDAYFSGTTKAVGIELASVKKIVPISIGHLKVMRKGFHPPQVIARITLFEAQFLTQFSVAA